MTYLEKKLTGMLFWQTHFPSDESASACKELLTQLEQAQVGGGMFPEPPPPIAPCPSPNPNN